jgi:hypothetical protein
MRKSLALALASAFCLLFAAPSFGASASTLDRPVPDWYTPELHAQVLAAGPVGVPVAEEYLNTECPGYQAPGVQANGCIVSPAGCTANFIYTNGSSKYIGTAAHCTDKVGGPVVMQVDSTTLAVVGTVAARTAQEEPGDDAAIIKIDPLVEAKWGVNPAVPFLGGPTGAYTGCDPQGVKSYGHGYGIAVAQGKPNIGLATYWYDDGYGWNGTGLPGDSGSGVLTADGLAAGNFTHLIVNWPGYNTANAAGTRVTRIMDLFNVSLVNADGSTTAPTSTSCGTPDGGGGSGGSGGGGNGGKGGKGGGKGKRS